MKATRRTTASKPEPLLRNLSSAIEQRLGPIEYRPIEGVRGYANNPRKHPEKQLVQLTASMQEFGFAMPVLIDTDGMIIAGEARVEVARRLGIPEVPVLVADHWSTAQVKAYRLADNRLAEGATWDLDLLRIELESVIEIGEVGIEILGWSTGEIDVLLDGTTVDDDADGADEVPEAPLVPVARAGDLWLLRNHRLLCGSSLEPESWQRLMAGATAAMVLTDAPFNVRINGHVSGGGKHAEFAMASGG